MNHAKTLASKSFARFIKSKAFKIFLKSILIFIILFVKSHITLSKGNFENGYIITADHDTLYGLVQYQRDIYAHYICNFKYTPSDTLVKAFTARNIKGYGYLRGGAYKSVPVNLYKHHPNVNFRLGKLFEPQDYHRFKSHMELIKHYPEKDINSILTRVEEEPFEKQQVFLNIFVAGEISLYKYGNDYFIHKNNYEIKHFQARTDESEDEPLKRRRQVGILKYLMSDCQEVFEKTDHLRLKDKFLTKLVEEYNRCVDSPYHVYDADIPWVELKPGLTLGYNLSRLYSSKNHAYPILEGETLRNNQNLISGFSLEIRLPRDKTNFSFLFEANYFASQYYTVIEEQIDINNFEKHQIFFQFHELQVPIALRYSFENVFLQPIKPYINAGGFLSYHLNTDSYYNHYLQTNISTIFYYEEEGLYPFKNFHFGVWAGVGMLKKIINNHTVFFEIRYLNSGRFIDLQYPFGVKEFDISKTHLIFVLGVRY